MNEGRRFERFPVAVPARIELLRSRRKHRIIETSVSELSAAGCLVPALKSLPAGRNVRVHLYLLFRINGASDKHEIIEMTVTGVVARSGPSGAAIAFNEDFMLKSSNSDDSNTSEVRQSFPEAGCADAGDKNASVLADVKILLEKSKH